MFQWLKEKFGYNTVDERDDLIKEQNNMIQVLVIYLGALILNKHGSKVKIERPFLEMMINNPNLVLDEKLLDNNSIEIEVKDISGELNDN